MIELRIHPTQPKTSFVVAADQPVVVEAFLVEGKLFAFVYDQDDPEAEPVGAFDANIDNAPWRVGEVPA